MSSKQGSMLQPLSISSDHHHTNTLGLLSQTARMTTTIPPIMRAARCLSYNSSPLLSIVDIPTPQPGRNEILIKLTAASLCHTDIGMAFGQKQNEGSQCPMTAGHEPCGTIAALGADVTGFKMGERVGFVNHAGACGRHQAMKYYMVAPDAETGSARRLR